MATKITYATLGGEQLDDLHRALDDAIATAPQTFGREYLLYINGQPIKAEQQFEDRSPIGRHFTFKRTGAEYTVEIVGVAKDLKKADPHGEWRPVYCPILQDLPSLNAIVLIRADGDASAVLAEATVLKIGKTLAFVSVDIRREHDRVLVAQGRMT